MTGPEVPVAVSFDLHANLNPDIADLANIICGYKTYPHIDMLETGARALNLLGRTIRGEISPVSSITSAGFAPSSFNMSTDQGPMRDMQTLAKKLEQENGFFDVSVFGGFVYADSVDTGATISICAAAKASDKCALLADIFRRRAPLFDVKLSVAKNKLVEIREWLDKEKVTGPIAVLEPSDNIFSGGGADTPGLLKAALVADIHFPCLFAFFRDSEVVQEASTVGTGNVIQCQLGGRLTREFGDPIEINARVDKLTHGQFTNLGPMEKNLRVNLGPTAVLTTGNLSIIITSENIPVNDRAYFDLHDINLNDYAIVYVKGKNHFKSAFEDQFSQIISVETPGPAASDIRSFDFKNLPAERLNFAINIRHADAQDAQSIAEIHTSSWRDVYRNILPSNYLDHRIEQERQQFWTQKLAQLPEGELVMTINSGDIVLGFIWSERDDEPGYDATIHAFHIEAGVKSCGYGKRLLKAAVQALIESGLSSVCLRVFDDNHAAVGFYEKLGGIKDQSGIDSFSGANAPDSRIGWKDIHQLLVNLD